MPQVQCQKVELIKTTKGNQIIKGKLALKKIKKKIRSFFQKNSLHLMAICFTLLAVAVLIIFLKSGGHFNDSIMPEIFGFCLEGLVFASIVSYLKAREKQKKHKQIKNVMLSTLMPVLVIIESYYTWKTGDKDKVKKDRIVGTDYFNPDNIELFSSVFNGKPDSYIGIDDISYEIKALLQSIENITLLSTLLEPMEILSWNAIKRSSKAVCEANDEKDQYHHIGWLLIHLKQFLQK